MPRALEVISGYVHSVSSTLTALTMATGDSATVRAFNPASSARLLGIGRQGATAGIVRVRSPLFHDNVKGIHFAVSETPSWALLPPEIAQPLHPQDNLILEGNGESSGYDTHTFLLEYDDLPGAAARLASEGDIVGNYKSTVTVEVATTSASTPASWTDTVITTTDDLLHANTDYAVLGYTVDTAIAGVAIKGVDTSNLRVGATGKVFGGLTDRFFLDLSRFTGRPCIPVFNSANKASTYVSTIDSGASTTSNITLVLAELARPFGS